MLIVHKILNYVLVEVKHGKNVLVEVKHGKKTSTSPRHRPITKLPHLLFIRFFISGIGLRTGSRSLFLFYFPDFLIT